MVAAGASVAAGLEPGRTVPAQLGGLAGATAGALTTAMFAADGSDVALGALIGTAAGFGGGAALGVALDVGPVRIAAPALPGRWSASLLPGGPNGTGWTLAVRGDGW
jgi:hypothetical protein